MSQRACQSDADDAAEAAADDAEWELSYSRWRSAELTTRQPCDFAAIRRAIWELANISTEVFDVRRIFGSSSVERLGLSGSWGCKALSRVISGGISFVIGGLA